MTVGGHSLPAAAVDAAVEASRGAVGAGFLVIGVEPTGSDGSKQAVCGQAECAVVRLTDGRSGAATLVQLRPVVAVLDVSRQNVPDAPARLTTHDEVVSAATSVEALRARLAGRTFASAVASGGDGPWCFGPAEFPGNFCDTVMLFIDGEPGGPLLVSVNWITGAAGVSGVGR